MLIWVTNWGIERLKEAVLLAVLPRQMAILRTCCPWLEEANFALNPPIDETPLLVILFYQQLDYVEEHAIHWDSMCSGDNRCRLRKHKVWGMGNQKIIAFEQLRTTSFLVHNEVTRDQEVKNEGQCCKQSFPSHASRFVLLFDCCISGNIQKRISTM